MRSGFGLDASRIFYILFGSLEDRPALTRQLRTLRAGLALRGFQEKRLSRRTDFEDES